MKTLRTISIGGPVLLACTGLLSNAIAQAEQASLDELVRRIPILASGDSGMSNEEQELAKQLRACGAEAVPRLLPLLEHENGAVRDLVGYVLRDAAGLKEEHLDALIRARKRGNGWIPPAIARVGTPRAIEFLVHDLERRPQTHTQVTYALQLAGEPAAIALAKRFRVKRSEKFDECASFVFGELGDRATAAVGPLLDAALDDALDADLRRRAITALGSCGKGAHPVAARLLMLAASDPADFEAGVEFALVEMRALESIPILLRRLAAHADIWVLRDLDQFGADVVAAGPAVLKVLDHEDRNLRVAAVHTLGHIGYLPAADVLARLAGDGDDWMLAAAAVDSLVRLHATSTLSSLEGVGRGHWSPFVREKALRAARTLQGIAAGTVDPRAVDSDEHEPSPPDGVPKRPMPTLNDGPGALRVEGGLLLGATRGEWGGEVVFAPTGQPARTVLTTNTHGLHRLGERIVAVTGLSHLTENRGVLYRIERGSDGSFSATWWKRLPGVPVYSGIRADGALFVRCSGGDVVVLPDGAIEFAR